MLRRSLAVAALLVACLPGVGSAVAQEGQRLTIERIVGSPSLDGPRARGVKFSPDGRLVTYLKAKATDQQRTDLWAFDVARGEHRLLVDSDRLTAAAETEAERARRERQRIRDTGIIEYAWAKDGRTLLFPYGGDVYLMAVAADGTVSDPRQITATPDAAEVDAKLSPGGRYAGYTRGPNLYAFDRQAGREVAIAEGGTDTVAFGVAEFVAQEELGRTTGHWWSPGDRYVAYTRVDEAAVPLVNRYDYGAEGVTVVPQRYPFAGGPNARVTLHVRDLASGQVVDVDLGDPSDLYLARVHWRPDGSALLVERLNRDQTRLDLVSADPGTGQTRTLISDASKTWVDWSDDVRLLKDGRIIWSSEQTGFRHLYLHAADGSLIRPLTSGDWPVASLADVDEATGTVLFTGYRETPLERHVYRTTLEGGGAGGGGAVTRLTEEPGLHAAILAPDGTTWLHTFSGLDQPPQMGLRSLKTGERLTWLEENALTAGHPYAPYLAARVKPEFGTLTAADGTTLHYSLLKPPGLRPGERVPVIMYGYGGPTAQLVTTGWPGGFTGHFLQLMVQRGYAVFTVDGRGSANRGQAFEDALYRAFGTAEVEDQTAGAAFLRTLPFVDPDRIALYGHSYGGYLVLKALARAPDLFAAGVAGAPVTVWTLYDTAYTERYLGRPDRDGDAYARASVLEDLDGLQDPVLLLHGMADDNVFFDNTVKVARALQERGVVFEMMTYPGERHSFFDPKLRAHYYRSIADFLDRRLRGPATRPE